MIMYDLRREKKYTKDQHNIFSFWSMIFFFFKKWKKVVLQNFNAIVFIKTSQSMPNLNVHFIVIEKDRLY